MKDNPSYVATYNPTACLNEKLEKGKKSMTGPGSFEPATI